MIRGDLPTQCRLQVVPAHRNPVRPQTDTPRARNHPSSYDVHLVESAPLSVDTLKNNLL
jgi:hypothetical protein